MVFGLLLISDLISKTFGQGSSSEDTSSEDQKDKKKKDSLSIFDIFKNFFKKPPGFPGFDFDLNIVLIVAVVIGVLLLIILIK